MNLKNGIESYLLLLLLTKMMHIGWKTSEEWCYGRSGGTTTTTTTTTRTRTISTATCVFTCCSFKGENNRNRKCETPVAPSNVIWIVPCSHASAASPESIRASGTTWVSPSWSKISNEKMLFWRSGSTKIMKVSDLKKPHAKLLQWFCVVHSFDHSGESLESVLLCSSHLCKLICAENVVSLQGPIKKRLHADSFQSCCDLVHWFPPFGMPRKQQQGRVRHTLQRSLSLLGPEVLNWNKPSRIFPDFCDSGGPLRDWHSWSRYCPSSVDLPSSTCRKKTSRVYRIPPSLGFFGVGHDKWKAGKQWRNWFSVKNATLRPATVVLSQ